MILPHFESITKYIFLLIEIYCLIMMSSSLLTTKKTIPSSFPSFKVQFSIRLDLVHFDLNSVYYVVNSVHFENLSRQHWFWMWISSKIETFRQNLKTLVKMYQTVPLYQKSFNKLTVRRTNAFHSLKSWKPSRILAKLRNSITVSHNVPSVQLNRT